MKKKLNVKFLRFATEPSHFPIYTWMKENYDVCETDHPDFILDFGHPYLHHWYDDAVKILFENENNVPNFNTHDYAVGFDYLTFGDRYLRIPLFARYPSYDRYAHITAMTDEQLLNREFCSFVVSNPWVGDHIRTRFFKRLSEYRPIASGGRFMNNVGGPVVDKIDFCRKYKFNIAFENTPSLGYTTEKIMDAYSANTIPIYWGNPTVETDFNLGSMVRIRDEDDVDRAVEEVIRLDKDDEAYLKVVKACRFVGGVGIDVYRERMENFLRNIFDQDPKHARRRNSYGYQPALQRNISTVMRVDYKLLQFHNKLRTFKSYSKLMSLVASHVSK